MRVAVGVDVAVDASHEVAVAITQKDGGITGAFGLPMDIIMMKMLYGHCDLSYIGFDSL
jgi:hypothetical protein